MTAPLQSLQHSRLIRECMPPPRRIRGDLDLPPGWYDHFQKLRFSCDYPTRPSAEQIIQAMRDAWHVCKSPRCVRCHPETATPYELDS